MRSRASTVLLSAACYWSECLTIKKHPDFMYAINNNTTSWKLLLYSAIPKRQVVNDSYLS